MGYKSVKTLGTLSGVAALAFLGFDIWDAVSTGSAGGPSGRSVWLAFFLLGLLATRVGAVLESQAAEISELKRRLADRQLGGA